MMKQRGVRQRCRERGLSLVELMVGLTVGMVVVAAASLLMSGQLFENRRLLAEAQVQQDLRASADIITRELRRASAVGVDAALLRQAWLPGAIDDAQPSLYAAIGPAPAASASVVTFDYNPEGGGTISPLGFGFRLNSSDGTIETLLVAGGWQDLTDPNTLNVTSFLIERLPDTVHRLHCPKACPDGTADCWPTIHLRTLEFVITASSRAVPEITRTHRSRVRVRNDWVDFYETFTTPTGATAGRVCPP
jgi:type II secretory pathway pseudopilin PulG